MYNNKKRKITTSADPDEMPHSVPVHLRLHYLANLTLSLLAGTRLTYFEKKKSADDNLSMKNYTAFKEIPRHCSEERLSKLRPSKKKRSVSGNRLKILGTCRVGTHIFLLYFFSGK